MRAHQPPRRVVQHVKDLVRAGYTILKPGDGQMTPKVAGLGDTIQGVVKKLNDRAEGLANSLQAEADGIDKTLDVVEGRVENLKESHKQLRNMLNMLGNDPPHGERLTDEKK